MLRQSKTNTPLDYLRSSPVRGQIDQQDSRTPKGWRYLQTTDTLDEFKVLLPPMTASMYEQLLKLESLELTKKSVSWDRILEIRHLKDRMIRKCQKLSKAPPTRRIGRGEPFRFQTVVAPADFRLKEMEKWFRQQQLRISSVNQRPVHHSHSLNTRNSFCCSRCANSTQPHSHSKTRIRTPPPTKTKEPSSASETDGTDTQIEDLAAEFVEEPDNLIAPIIPLDSQKPSSPEPLPHLLRHHGTPLIFDSPGSASPPNIPADNPSSKAPGSTPKVEVTAKRLRHQRSCIKRSNTGDSVKTVSWADDRDLAEHFSKFTNAAQEAQTIDNEWEDMRQIYISHMAHLEGLEKQVQESLHRLELEAEGLRKVCADITEQKESLRAVVNRFGRKQSDYRAKVQVVLDEANGFLSSYGNKDPQPEGRSKFMPSINEDSREEYFVTVAQ